MRATPRLSAITLRPTEMVLLFACRWQLRHLGDFAGQCRYAYDNGATMNDVVKVVTYVTDVRNLPGREVPHRSAGWGSAARAHLPEYQSARMAGHAGGGGCDSGYRGALVSLRKTRRESFMASPNPGLTTDLQTAGLLGNSAME